MHQYTLLLRAFLTEQIKNRRKALHLTQETMAEKLRRICTGIRKAFELTGESYQWEQYLPQ